MAARCTAPAGAVFAVFTSLIAIISALSTAEPSREVTGFRSILLAESPACAADFRRICSPGLLENNFAALNCVQNHKLLEDSGLSAKCHHLLWQYKRNITRNDQSSQIAQKQCQALLKSYPECSSSDQNMLLCLLEHIENATGDCQMFLYRMENVVFSDYRLIEKFADACDTDIDKFQCGRLSTDSKQLHSQGATIECLQKQADILQEKCQKEIIWISKIQGEDFQFDRPLYFACRDDREKFCSQVESGEGGVYRCLMRHRLQRTMTLECAKKLLEREKLTMRDYRVNKGLNKACKDDIRQYKCRDEVSHRRDFRLAQILLCLENSIHNDYPVAAECKAELLVHRRLLLESYQLTPDLAAACEQDIISRCQKKLELGGRTVHCLMKHMKGPKKIADQCRREVEKMIKISDAGEDWRVDPVLQELCQPVVDVACQDVKPGKGRVLSCLMDHVDSSHMREDCRDALLQIQYFVARDFKLDPQLYEACHSEAVKYCHAKSDWHQDPAKMDPERGPIVLPCLYRYAYHVGRSVPLSEQCLFEVRRVMRQRAVSVDLQPEVEEPCLGDLASLCNSNVDKGQEIECLQQNLEKLEQDCRLAVGNLTEEQAEHIELNYPLFQLCVGVLKKVCADALSKEVDHGDLLQCLINNKNEFEVKSDVKCRAGIEHFQLVSLKDYRFTTKFKEACKPDVIKYCSRVRTKAEVVACLSTIVADDIIKIRERPRVTQTCRRQLKVELFLRDENIHLDPRLDRACEEDQKRLCPYVEPGEGRMLECLRSHRERLSPHCHHVVFRREEQMQNDNSIDYKLFQTCKGAIKRFCAESEASQVLDCLADYRREAGISDNCKNLIHNRLLERNDDYRLNPKLKNHCRRDVEKFCLDVVDRHRDKETELEGSVVRCLRENYLKKRLSDECEPIVLTIMRQGAQLDPVLAKACKAALERPCDLDDPEECLKQQFQSKLIHSESCRIEVARLIHEGKADVQSDPILYKACSSDILRWCYLSVPGHGHVLSCLMMNLEKNQLDPECKSLLSRRIEMFEYAAQVAPVETLQDVVRQLQQSPARNWFMIVFSGGILALFLIGVTCGRFTKRIPKQLKNK